MMWGYAPWPCKPYLDDAMSILSRIADDEEREEILNDLRDRNAQLWLAVDGGLIAALVSRKDGDTLEIWKCAGPVLPFAIDYLEMIERSADGFRKMRLSGRKGWERFLSSAGWYKDGEDMVKDINNG